MSFSCPRCLGGSTKPGLGFQRSQAPKHVLGQQEGERDAKANAQDSVAGCRSTLLRRAQGPLLSEYICSVARGILEAQGPMMSVLETQLSPRVMLARQKWQKWAIRSRYPLICMNALLPVPDDLKRNRGKKQKGQSTGVIVF